MNFKPLIQKTEEMLAENASAILTGFGIAGTVATAVLTGRASFRAAETIWDKEEETLTFTTEDAVILSKKEKFKLVWPLFIPPMGVGAITVSSIFFANRISTRKAAALAAAYGISEKAFHEYKEKVVETLGSKKDEAIRDGIAQDRVTKDPVDGREIILVGTGDVLCYEALTGRYFMSTIENIKKAENKVNYEILHHMYASLSMFYDEIGIPPTSYSDDVGWNSDHILDVTYSSVLSSDGRPCISIDFGVAPVPGYTKLY